MAGGMGLFMGSCSGHGLGSGSSHHPGLGGSILPGCVMPPNDPKIVPKPVQAMNATTLWPPTPQLPLGVGKAAAARVDFIELFESLAAIFSSVCRRTV